MSFLPEHALTLSPIMAFGLLLLVGALGGYLAHLWSWLPSITGFMMVGFLIGPGALGLLDAQTLGSARILVDIALALILYRLGTSLDLRFIRKSSGLLLVSLWEAGLTFATSFALLTFLGFPMVIAAVIGAILISSSPAVLLHVAHEVGADGPMTESAKTLVALNNLWSFMIFVLVVPALLLQKDTAWEQVVLQPLYMLMGSALLGLVMGLILHFVSSRTHNASQYKMALVVGTLMLTIGLAHELKLSALFAPLLVGIVVCSIERQEAVSSLEFGSAFELFFIVLFVYAGANLHLDELIQYGPVILALVLVRGLVKVLGVVSASWLQKQPIKPAISSGLLLIPMAGLAIGLVQTSTQIVPEQAGLIAAIVLGAVTVFETIGPPIAAFAFRYAGEVTGGHAAGDRFAHWRSIGAVPIDVSKMSVHEISSPIGAVEKPTGRRNYWWYWLYPVYWLQRLIQLFKGKSKPAR